MEHYLVIANQALCEERMRTLTKRLADQHRCDFDLRVPATPSRRRSGTSCTGRG